MLEILVIILSLVIIILLWVVQHLRKRSKALQTAVELAQSKKKSLATRYGQITEQFIPLLSVFPLNPKSFRFLGNPVDGVAFEQDRIVFCEFKTSRSRLSPKQKHYRNLVEQKKVEWLEIRLDTD
ncbi:MAG: Holliday junction resolvase-like protein [Candidatus Ranarchaeia archaeon]